MSWATLKERVQGARAFVAVLSPAAVSSRVRQEIEWALAAEDRAAETGGVYRFIPVFTGGIRHGFLDWLKRPEVLGIDADVVLASVDCSVVRDAISF